MKQIRYDQTVEVGVKNCHLPVNFLATHIVPRSTALFVFLHDLTSAGNVMMCVACIESVNHVQVVDIVLINRKYGGIIKCTSKSNDV